MIYFMGYTTEKIMEEKDKKREYKPIDLRTMETLICIMVILVHFFTIFFYAHYRVYVMLVSNIISISAYIILYLVSGKGIMI